MPVQNRGEKAAGMAHLAVAVHVLEEAIPLLGMGDEAGRDAAQAMTKLAKHIPPGSVPSGVENSVLQKIMLKNRQNAMNVAQMRAPSPGAAPGAPASGGPPPGGPSPGGPSPQMRAA
jgi:hypothetical protein